LTSTVRAIAVLVMATESNDTGTHLRSVHAHGGGVREIFTTKVEDYVASRPEYPGALFDGLVAAGALPAEPAVVADIGSGTGLLTRGLLVRGHRVFAVEPNAAMRAVADAALADYAGYGSVDGAAEATGLEDGSVDLVTAAQALHWFELDGARREFRRILKPHGQVALIWNDRQLADPLNVALDELFEQFGGARRCALVEHENHSRVWPFFGGKPEHQMEIPHEHRLDRATLLSLVFSRSYIPPRESEVAAEVVRQVDAIFDAHAAGGVVTMRYHAVVMAGKL
jgi:SAM-dependent methyltransferase